MKYSYLTIGKKHPEVGLKLIDCPVCHERNMAYCYNEERVVVKMCGEAYIYDWRLTKARCLACLTELKLFVVPKPEVYLITEEGKK